MAEDRDRELVEAMQKLLMNAPNLTKEQVMEQLNKMALAGSFSVIQVEKLLDTRKNNAGGYSYQVDDMMRLSRFIVLGSDSGAYYVTPRDMMKTNKEFLISLLKQGCVDDVLKLVREYSMEGKCPKDDNLLFVLALCACYQDKELDAKKVEKVRQGAYRILNDVCSIPTKLFMFNEYCQQIIQARKAQSEAKKKEEEKMDEDAIPSKALPLHPPSLQGESSGTSTAATTAEESQRKRKEPAESDEMCIELSPSRPKKPKRVPNPNTRSACWGRMRRNGISKFYTDPKKNANKLLYHLTKYKKRNNWSHKQVLGYAHPKVKPTDSQKFAKDLVFTYVTRGFERFTKMAERVTPEDTIAADVAQNIKIVEELNKLSPKREEDEEKLIKLFKEYGTTDGTVANRRSFLLAREHVPNGFFRSAKVCTHHCLLLSILIQSVFNIFVVYASMRFFLQLLPSVG